MKKKLLLILLLSCCSIFAQERKNIAAFELAGHSEALFFANYERLFYLSEKIWDRRNKSTQSARSEK